MSQEPWNVLHNTLTAGERIRLGLAFKASNPTHAALSNLAPDLGCRTIGPCAGKESWATSSEHEFQASKTTDPTARVWSFPPWLHLLALRGFLEHVLVGSSGVPDARVTDACLCPPSLLT